VALVLFFLIRSESVSVSQRNPFGGLDGFAGSMGLFARGTCGTCICVSDRARDRRLGWFLRLIDRASVTANEFDIGRTIAPETALTPSTPARVE
jgi:hypothetical protein